MYPLALNNNRVKAVGGIIGEIGLEAIKRVENFDPQFTALKKIYGKTRSIEITCLAAVSNALVSYRLTGPGEDYWLEFSDYFTSKRLPIEVGPDLIVDTVIDFLSKSRYNRFLFKQKANRLTRFKKSGAHILLFTRCRELLEDIHKLLVVIANGIGSKPDAKTVVFAVKMVYYAARAGGIDLVLPVDIMIPVDRRIGLLSYTSGIVDVKVTVGSRRELEELLLRYSGVPREAWRRVALVARIPPLNIDSLIWFISKGLGRTDLSIIRRNAVNILLRILGEEYRGRILKLIREIYFRDFK